MARVKRGVTSHARHKKVLKQVKGQYGRRKNTIRVAKQALEKYWLILLIITQKHLNLS
jgi:large subunit ribosomal protein L20